MHKAAHSAPCLPESRHTAGCAQVIGVEPAGANAMAMSLEKGARVTLSKVDGFADGVAVKHVSLYCPRRWNKGG